MVDIYDIKRRTNSMADGVNSVAWAVIESRQIEVQNLRWNKRWDPRLQLGIEVGGEVLIPTYHGWVELGSNVTATDKLTADSGTTDLLVLRTYNYEDHKEMDMREVEDR